MTLNCDGTQGLLKPTHADLFFWDWTKKMRKKGVVIEGTYRDFCKAQRKLEGGDKGG